MSAGTQLELAQDHEVQPVAGEVSGLVKLAVEQKVPVEVLERLVALQERVTERNARMSFIQALTSFRDQCPPIPKTRANIQFSKVSRNGTKGPAMYAGLEDIDGICRPFASANGLIWTWDTTVDATLMHVSCKLLHVDGHFEVSTVSMPYESKAGASPQQKYAITQTYGMRYSLIAALGITTADADTDGNVPRNSAETVSDEQLADLKVLMDEVLGQKTDRFYGWLKESLGVELLGDVPASAYQTVKSALEARRR